MQAKLLLSQDIFSLEKNPTGWREGMDGVGSWMRR